MESLEVKKNEEGILPQIAAKGAKHQILIDLAKELPPIPTAVVHPVDRYSILGAVDAHKANLIVPIFVGPEDKIRKVAEEEQIDISSFMVVGTKHSHEAAEKSVAMVREGQAEALMKGSLHTDELMSAVVRKDLGIPTERRMSHISAMDVPQLSQVLFVTDAAINIYPDLLVKQDITQNAIDLAHSLGIAKPKVAILSAVETITPKIPSTLEAASLCKMADRGQITGAIVDGPLAFDNAISEEAARIKGIRSEVSGHADIFVVPDLEAGNMLVKQLTYMAEAQLAGIVLGARVPIILNSRSDNNLARKASCALAELYVFYQKNSL
ncbi:MAG: bifunctional enoyl-CoA hydratase/phosphate acetyltransferase [SAR324 cluster bacterium]|nr:bifunctional enoyl-CoA hydratase/phosphate acetyltransferase [SAR324 cluster bacterium]